MAGTVERGYPVSEFEYGDARFLRDVLYATVYNTTGEMVRGLNFATVDGEVVFSVPIGEWHKIRDAFNKILNPEPDATPN